MQRDKIQKVFEEIICNMNAVSNTPRTNKDCAYCDGKCARKSCLGYTADNKEVSH